MSLTVPNEFDEAPMANSLVREVILAAMSADPIRPIQQLHFAYDDAALLKAAATARDFPRDRVG
jgi:hypothetical protein